MSEPTSQTVSFGYEEVAPEEETWPTRRVLSSGATSWLPKL